MKLLLTQGSLLYRGGSELFVLDVARALKRRGHEPWVFTSLLGLVATELRAAHVPVVDDLRELPAAPDLIHGQHHLEALQALVHFPRTPAVHFCHGVLPWQEAPLQFPRIVRYVAVSELIRTHLVEAYGISRDRVELVLNFADLDRFHPRSPLPPRPRRGLVLSNRASEATHAPAVRAACMRAGLEVDVLGHASGNPTTAPEAALPSYDLVFAAGRSAIEALVVGTAVVTCNTEGVGAMVTTANLDQLRRLNFGLGTFTDPVTQDAIFEQIQRYEPKDAAQVSARMRREAGLEDAVDRLLRIYECALREFERGPAPTDEDERAAVIHHARWLSLLLLHEGRGAERSDALQLIQRVAAERWAIERERETYAGDRAAMERERAAYAQDRAAMQGERDRYARYRAAFLRARRTRLQQTLAQLRLLLRSLGASRRR